MLTAYLIYEIIINKDNISENETTNLFLSNFKQTLDENSYHYIENNHYLVDNSIKENLLNYRTEKRNLYITISDKLNKDNSDKEEITNLIKSYLDNKEMKNIEKDLKIIKNKQENKINFVVN